MNMGNNMGMGGMNGGNMGMQNMNMNGGMGMGNNNGMNMQNMNAGFMHH